MKNSRTTKYNLQNTISSLPGLKVAIIHDWLVGGGAEKVVQALHEMFPEALIYTSYCTDEWRKKLDNKVVTGFLQKWPFGHLRKFLPLLRIWWFKHLNLTNYDLIISSSGNGEAKGIKKINPKAIHVCYCHSPTHFYWDKYEEYLDQPGFGIFNPLAKVSLKLLVKPLRKWDFKAAQRPDHIIANSTHIQQMIKKYYNRDSVVIHPPLDTTRFSFSPTTSYHSPIPKTRQGFITVGRQVPYKRTDIAIEACNNLNVPLTIIGNGPEHKKLLKMAGNNIKFIPQATDEQIVQGLASAQAFIFCSKEDFGITPIEAMASGTPVIAYKAGGALDYITPKTGLFFEEQTVTSLEEAIKQFNPQKYTTQDLQALASNFSKQKFIIKMSKYLEEKCIY